MDNAAFHKSEFTKALMENAGYQLLFLSPYFSDFNPIKRFGANVQE